MLLPNLSSALSQNNPTKNTRFETESDHILPMSLDLSKVKLFSPQARQETLIKEKAERRKIIINKIGSHMREVITSHGSDIRAKKKARRDWENNDV